ncbi:CPXV225 protein [Cowpox virus]|uniref:CPXV225 protein n=1 Tax=Cowpox virus TaxID=10243 RepID=U5TA45_COWPX|nr:CPXV225 protein [Cowpox virus]
MSTITKKIYCSVFVFFFFFFRTSLIMKK